MSKYSINLMAALLQVLLIAIAFHSGDAIKCFVCNSDEGYQGEACRNVEPYVNNTNSDLVKDCSTQPRSVQGDYVRCRIIVQDIDGKSRVVRSCATWPDPSKPNRCIDRTGTAKIKIQYCECEGDGCNGSSALYASLLTVVLASFITKPFF